MSFLADSNTYSISVGYHGLNQYFNLKRLLVVAKEMVFSRSDESFVYEYFPAALTTSEQPTTHLASLLFGSARQLCCRPSYILRTFTGRRSLLCFTEQTVLSLLSTLQRYSYHLVTHQRKAILASLSRITQVAHLRDKSLLYTKGLDASRLQNNFY